MKQFIRVATCLQASAKYSESSQVACSMKNAGVSRIKRCAVGDEEAGEFFVLAGVGGQLIGA